MLKLAEPFVLAFLFLLSPQDPLCLPITHSRFFIMLIPVLSQGVLHILSTSGEEKQRK
jgi:hypothetical protein